MLKSHSNARPQETRRTNFFFSVSFLFNKKNQNKKVSQFDEIKVRKQINENKPGVRIAETGSSRRFFAGVILIETSIEFK